MVWTHEIVRLGRGLCFNHSFLVCFMLPLTNQIIPCTRSGINVVKSLSPGGACPGRSACPLPVARLERSACFTDVSYQLCRSEPVHTKCQQQSAHRLLPDTWATLLRLLLSVGRSVRGGLRVPCWSIKNDPFASTGACTFLLPCMVAKRGAARRNEAPPPPPHHLHLRALFLLAPSARFRSFFLSGLF